MNRSDQKGKFTAAGTNIEEVKQLNAQSGMTYNEAKAYIAKTTGGHHTEIFSDTNVEEVKRKNQALENE
ncbi:gamma-type small acid-soluble spore protein [Scopulibacillus cellulosilyticus]|uniref:Small, acid-soluble spore protein gamma-type n=1 Tax=Scopulibacillus cellulosilyticus TaxID=2665665 RepID=A0ABW2PQW4_9BACL